MEDKYYTESHKKGNTELLNEINYAIDQMNAVEGGGIRHRGNVCRQLELAEEQPRWLPHREVTYQNGAPHLPA